MPRACHAEMAVVCDGLLVESTEGVGECDQGDACQALALREDYGSYRAAHGRSLQVVRPRPKTNTAARADPARNSQDLWIGFVGHAATWFGFSMSAPLLKVAPARTSATRCGPLMARQRSWAAMMCL